MVSKRSFVALALLFASPLIAASPVMAQQPAPQPAAPQPAAPKLTHEEEEIYKILKGAIDVETRGQGTRPTITSNFVAGGAAGGGSSQPAPQPSTTTPKPQATPTPAPAAVGKPGNFALSFGLGSATLTSASKHKLDIVASALVNPEFAKYAVRVDGHASADGDDAKNMTLSQARAESVKTYLASKGVPATRIDAKGFGETRLLPPPVKPESPANRRIEFSLVEPGK